MVRLIELVIGGTSEPWKTLGFTVDGNHVHVADVDIICDGSSPGIHSWAFASKIDGRISLDGIDTTLRTSSVSPPQDSFICGEPVVALDHVVVNTDDLHRTCAAIDHELGLPLRRVREAGNGMRQGFHRADNTVIEVVSAPSMSVRHAMLWGFVPVVNDLESVARHLGPDVLSAPKPAVQPGRSIATVRPAVGLGIPLAFMTPRGD